MFDHAVPATKQHKLLGVKQAHDWPQYADAICDKKGSFRKKRAYPTDWKARSHFGNPELAASVGASSDVSGEATSIRYFFFVEVQTVGPTFLSDYFS